MRHKLFRLGDDVVLLLPHYNECLVIWKNKSGEIIFETIYRECEYKIAEAKYDDLVLALRIEYTLKNKQLNK